MKKLTARQIALNGVVAGLYAAITILTASFAYGNIQFRIADALCVLVVLEPTLTVGLTLGCLISNIFSTVSALDIVIGTAGTLLGCLLAARVKKDWLVPVPIMLANAVLVGAMLAYVLTPTALVQGFFINGGEGGLGIAAIQLAKHVFGCKVVAQVASDANGAFCREVGADVTVNRFTGDLVATLAANPPDVAIDPVGGPLMGKCVATMPYRGRWISLASMAGPETTLDVNLLWRKNLRVIGSTLRSRTPEEKAAILAGLVRDVWPAFEARQFAPFVHKVLPIAEAAEAHAILERGENRGKVVLEVG